LLKTPELFLNDKLSWSSIDSPLINHKINNFKPLLQRVEKDQVDAMVEASKQDIAQIVTKPY
jgi:methionyl-tRNA synthetase